MSPNKNSMSNEEILEKLKKACVTPVGVLESGFLCQSLGVLNLGEPLQVAESETVNGALKLLRTHKSGCVCVTDAAGKLTGIFTERDVLLKIVDKLPECGDTPVSEFMTRNPVAEQFDTTIAFALNLMSHGGFRHIPVVDEERIPLAMVSVKNIVDYLVERFVEDLAKV